MNLVGLLIMFLGLIGVAFVVLEWHVHRRFLAQERKIATLHQALFDLGRAHQYAGERHNGRLRRLERRLDHVQFHGKQ